jgi:hypothetical protein
MTTVDTTTEGGARGESLPDYAPVPRSAVGPTSVYAFVQNVGVISDHIHGCFRATD